MPHFPHGYLPCGTFNTPLYLGVITPSLALKATCLERDKHNNPFRIDSDTIKDSMTE